MSVLDVSQPLKAKIKTHFNKAFQTYDDYAAVQKQVCTKAIEMLLTHRKDYHTIADFACGTGVSTEYLCQALNFNQLYAIDFSEKLLQIAADKIQNTNVAFMLEDFDNVLFQKNSLDLIFCNMGLQWSLDLKMTLQLLHFYLKPDSGLFVFSMPMKGTFSELDPRYVNSGCQSSDIELLLNQCGFKLISVYNEVYVKTFPSQIAALRSIKAVGANCVMTETNKINGLKSKNFIDSLFMSTTECSLTYNINSFVVRK